MGRPHCIALAVDASGKGVVQDLTFKGTVAVDDILSRWESAVDEATAVLFEVHDSGTEREEGPFTNESLLDLRAGYPGT